MAGMGMGMGMGMDHHSVATHRGHETNKAENEIHKSANASLAHTLHGESSSEGCQDCKCWLEVSDATQVQVVDIDPNMKRGSGRISAARS